MYIAYIQDYNFMGEEAAGGAEISDSLIYTYGITQQNHNIELITPRTQINNLTKYDLIIVSNFASFISDNLKEERFLNLLSTAKKVLFYIHDYLEVCKWRLYKNNRENCRTHCPRLPFAKKFYEHVDGIVWLSPKHRESTLFSMPELEKKPYLLMPSPIDITQFDENIHPELKDVKRIPNTVIASNVLPFKGSENLLKYTQQHREYKFTLVGAEPDQNLQFPSNVNYVGRVAHKDMPRLLRSFQFAIELPGTIQPYERFVSEAAISGCTIIANDNVGALSYSWFYDLIEHKKQIFTSPKRFWKFVEGL